jgi:MYXO-CTERM domain-containing protein
MPTTGTGPDPQLPLVGALGLLLLAFGLALRRRVPR